MRRRLPAVSGKIYSDATPHERRPKPKERNRISLEIHSSWQPKAAVVATSKFLHSLRLSGKLLGPWLSLRTSTLQIMSLIEVNSSVAGRSPLADTLAFPLSNCPAKFSPSSKGAVTPGKSSRSGTSR